MGAMRDAINCCLKTIRFWSVCAETPCPCTSVNAVVEEDQVLPLYWSGIPCDSRMEVAARVDDVTHGKVYTARIWNDADGLKNYEYTVDNEDGEGPDLYPWQVAEALAAVINAASGDFDTPITATGYRDGFIKLAAGSVPIRADFLKDGSAMTDHATRWPTPAVTGPCTILGSVGAYDSETSGGVSRVSNFAGFKCWDSIAALPPCVDNEFTSAIAGKAVLVVDSKVYVWRARVSRLTAGTNYAILRTTQVGVYSPSHDDLVYTTTAGDEAGTHNDLAQTIADAINTAWGGDGYVASAPGGGWVEVHHSTGHRRFGNDSTRYFKIVHDGYTDDMDTWVVSNVTYYGLEMTGWASFPVTGQQNARLMDAGLGEEVFTHTLITGTDTAMADAYAAAFNSWAAGTPEFKGFRDVTAARVYWGIEHTGTVPTASGDPFKIYLDSGASASNDYYNDCRVEIISGTGAGQVRTITGYAVAGPTKLASVTPDWGVSPDTSSVFQIYEHVGVKFESANPAHPADLEGDQPDKGPHDGAHEDIFWARNGNLTSGEDQITNAWTDAGIVRKCCGPLHGAVYAVRFTGTLPSAFDVTASITVDNENTTGTCKGDGPDDTPAAIADKWVTEYNSVSSGIPADVRPTATHTGGGVIVLEGNVYGSDPETAAPFNFTDPQPDSAWLGFSVIQQPDSGEAETDTVWYYDGLLTEMPYRPFVGWSYLGSSTEWHAANIAEANIVGSEYADGLDCTEEEPPDSACPGKCHNDCLSLDATVTISGTVTWRQQVEADPCEVEVIHTTSFNTGPLPLFSGCTSVAVGHTEGPNLGYPDCATGTNVSVAGTVCPTYGSFQVSYKEVASGGAPPCNTHLVDPPGELFATFNYDEGSGGWVCDFSTLCDGQPDIIGTATVTFNGSTQWHMGTDEECESTFEKCLPGANPLP